MRTVTNEFLCNIYSYMERGEPYSNAVIVIILCIFLRWTIIKKKKTNSNVRASLICLFSFLFYFIFESYKLVVGQE
jgi:hypothetical protein